MGEKRRGVRNYARAMLILAVAALLAAVLRLRGTGGTPPRHGGWRELGEDELT